MAGAIPRARMVSAAIGAEIRAAVDSL